MKRFVIFLAVLINLATLFPLHISRGCAGGDPCPWDGIYSFLNQGISADTMLKPFYFSFEKLYGMPSGYNVDMSENQQKKIVNIREWKQFYNNIPTENDIDTAVYYSTENWFTNIYNHITKNTPLPDSISRNSFVNRIIADADINTCIYLEFTKKIENETFSKYDWWEEPIKTEINILTRLIKEANSLFSAEKNEFLKLRFAYHVVRLNFLAEKYKDAVDFYNKNIDKKQSESVIKYWALGYKAGAMLRMKLAAEASYIYTRIFDECPSMRITAFYSFNRAADSNNFSGINLCKNNAEKVMFYALRGMKQTARSTEEMTAILGLEPDSPYLELLLVRELTKAEVSLNGGKMRDIFNPYISEYLGLIPENEARNNFMRLADVIKSAENKVKNKTLWRLASVYCSYLSGNKVGAAEQLSSIQNDERADNKLRNQARIFKIAIYLNDLTQISIEEANSVFIELKALGLDKKLPEYSDNYFDNYCSNYPAITVYFLQTCAYLFNKQQEYAHAFACVGQSQQLYSVYNLATIERIIEFYDKKNKNEFENFIFTNFFGTNYNRDNLLNVKATIYLTYDNLGAAADIFSQIDTGKIDPQYFEIDGDPFNTANINDCIDCYFQTSKYYAALEEYYKRTEKGDSSMAYPDWGDPKWNLPKVRKYNKLTYTLKLLELSKQVVESDNPANLYFMLGNAWYNTTYFSFANQALDFYRASSYIQYFDEEWYNKNFNYSQIWQTKDTAFIDCSRAYYYYKKALESEQNKEKQAQILFMMAKCEQNFYYADPQIKDDHDGILKRAKYRDSFKRLKSEFSDTKYYSEILRECDYFRKF